MRSESHAIDAGVSEQPVSGSTLRSSRPPDAPLEEDAFYDLLTNARRRACISFLSQTESEVSVVDIVDHIASVERTAREGAQDTDGGRAHEKSIYVSLRQTHLPRLAEHDVVAFDPDENVVEPTEKLESFVASRAATDRGQPWGFIALGLLGLGWLTGGILGVFGLVEQWVLLVSLGYVFLIFVLGLWYIQGQGSTVV